MISGGWYEPASRLAGRQAAPTISAAPILPVTSRRILCQWLHFTGSRRARPTLGGENDLRGFDIRTVTPYLFITNRVNVPLQNPDGTLVFGMVDAELNSVGPGQRRHLADGQFPRKILLEL